MTQLLLITITDHKAPDATRQAACKGRTHSLWEKSSKSLFFLAIFFMENVAVITYNKTPIKTGAFDMLSTQQQTYRSVLGACQKLVDDTPVITIVRMGIGPAPAKWSGPHIDAWINESALNKLPIDLPNGLKVLEIRPIEENSEGLGHHYTPYTPTPAMIEAAEQKRWDALNDYELMSLIAHFNRVDCEQDHRSKEAKPYIHYLEKMMTSCVEELESRRQSFSQGNAARARQKMSD